jgi:uncharacterized membrane protein
MTAPITPHTAVSSPGLPANVAGALAYVLGPITGVLFLVLEKDSPFVRFHAAQSVAAGVVMIALWIILSVLGAILAVVPIIGWLIGLALTLVVGLGSFVLWLLLMFRAYQGSEWEVPGLGGQARRLASRVPAVR